MKEAKTTNPLKAENIPPAFKAMMTPEDIDRVVNWSASRPGCEFDACMGRQCRWQWRLHDDGLQEWLYLFDQFTLATGSTSKKYILAITPSENP